MSGATKEQLEYNAYLLDVVRRCGLFKCTDCIFALWEDRQHGMEYKCCHPRTLYNSAWNDLSAALSGSACDVFEPSRSAASNVVGRMVETQEAVAALEDYAWQHTVKTQLHDSHDETRLSGICQAIDKQRMVRV